MEGISANRSIRAPVERYLASTRLAFGLLSWLAAGLMLWAWAMRDYRYLQAESGVGYALGIAGASMMTILLLYPLRKRLRFMRGWFGLKSWFRLHMLLGILGPSCILLHCNFQLGSTNSNVALASMLMVAGSGLVGRYLYGKFHYGLYGEQVRLGQLKEDLDAFYRGAAGAVTGEVEAQQLQALYLGCSKIIDSQQCTVSLRQLIGQRRWLRQHKRLLPVVGTPDRSLQDHYRALAGLLDKLAGLRLFERLFGLWHIVHIPVFLLMIVTAVVHIVVVHWF
jgi:hypothetical protein